MFNIPLTNQKLQNLLSNITDFCLSDEMLPIAREQAKRRNLTDKQFPSLHPASDAYLAEIMKHKPEDFGFPRSTYGMSIDMKMAVVPELVKYAKEYEKLARRLASFLGAPINAVACIYPEDGYMGWHHNGNASGYNILFSYSTDGEGSFDYWDQHEKKIVEMKDTPGWSIKVGRFPGYRDGYDRLFWHRAKTKNPRITLGWIINEKDLWIDMIKEISNGDFDQRVLTHR